MNQKAWIRKVSSVFLILMIFLLTILMKVRANPLRLGTHDFKGPYRGWCVVATSFFIVSYYGFLLMMLVPLALGMGFASNSDCCKFVFGKILWWKCCAFPVIASGASGGFYAMTEVVFFISLWPTALAAARTNLLLSASIQHTGVCFLFFLLPSLNRKTLRVSLQNALIILFSRFFSFFNFLHPTFHHFPTYILLYFSHKKIHTFDTLGIANRGESGGGKPQNFSSLFLFFLNFYFSFGLKTLSRPATINGGAERGRRPHFYVAPLPLIKVITA